MSKKLDLRMAPRIAHYFRDVDLTSNSRPELIPAQFPMNCESGDDQWSAGFLLRIAVRFQHLWATYGNRNGERTIEGQQPAVCFSPFNLADLIAVRNGLPPQNEAVTWFALTFPIAVAEKGGILPFIGEAAGRDGHGEDAGHKLHDSSISGSEWRWYYSGNYHRAMENIGMDGVEGNAIPGLKLCQKKWSGIGVVVPDKVTARVLQYDILSLIDRGLVSETHFDHILVCDQLPANLDRLAEREPSAVFSKACFDFKSCMAVTEPVIEMTQLSFSSRLSKLESSTRKKTVREQGGCWLWFQDNTDPYVRALIKAGRVKPNKAGRYLASLDELDPHRDLRERQQMATALAELLDERFGVRSCYYSVLNSQSPDGIPSYSGRWWESAYFITDGPEDDED